MHSASVQRLEKALPFAHCQNALTHFKKSGRRSLSTTSRRSISLRSTTLLGPQASVDSAISKVPRHHEDIPIHEALKHFSVSRGKRKAPADPSAKAQEVEAASAQSMFVRNEVYKKLQVRQATEREVDGVFRDLLQSRLFEDIVDVWKSWRPVLKDGTNDARLHETRTVVLIAWICQRADTTIDSPMVGLRKLFSPLRPPKSNRDFESYMKQFSLSATESDSVRKVLSAWETSDLQPNSGQFLAGLDNLISKFQADALQNMYSRALKHTTYMTSVSYHKFAEGFLRIGRPESTRKILDDMRIANIKVESSLWNALLLHAGHMRRFDDVKALWLIIQKSCVPDTVLYTSLIDAYFSCGSVDEALSGFEAMTRTQNALPNTITCNTVVKGLVNNQRVASAWEFVKNTAAPAGMKPDATTYNLLLRAFLREGDRERASLIGSVMQSQKLRDVATYTILLDNYTECMPSLMEFVKKAESVLSQMAKEQIQSNAHLYTTMIKAILFPVRKSGDYRQSSEPPKKAALAQAMKWLEQMKTNNVARTVLVYEILLRANFSANDPDSAFSLWNSMRRDRIAPDSGAYNTMISGLVRAGMLTAALQLYQKSLISGLKRETISITLLNAATDSDNKRIAQEVLGVILKNDPHNKSASMQAAIHRAAEQFDLELK